jgi:hypothetical protein
MKLLTLLCLSLLCFAQERVRPYKMSQLKMLVGEWYATGKNGQVEFHYDMELGMVGRVRPNSGTWRRMMVIHPEGQSVRADFYEMSGRVIHYNLDFADGHTLRFVEASAPRATQRRIVYRKINPEQLAYVFETGDHVTDTGTFAIMAGIRPLTE